MHLVLIAPVSREDCVVVMRRLGFNDGSRDDDWSWLHHVREIWSVR